MMNVSYGRLLRSLSLPVTMAGLVPAAILWGSAGAAPWSSPLLSAGGCLLVLIGLLIVILTIRTFATAGKGTLAPWDPPKELVVSGMYRHVRNPMISGVLVIIFGEALAFGSRDVFYWGVVFFAFNSVYFIFSEEPALARRFGARYDEYRANVPRWLPRISPWEADKER